MASQAEVAALIADQDSMYAHPHPWIVSCTYVGRLTSSATANYCDFAVIGTLALILALLDSRRVCLIMANAALVVYEYCITSRLEVQLFWRRKIRPPTVLFFLNRYLNLIAWCFYLYTFFYVPGSNQVSLGFQR